jgi:hypothetical protein
MREGHWMHGSMDARLVSPHFFPRKLARLNAANDARWILRIYLPSQPISPILSMVARLRRLQLGVKQKTANLTVCKLSFFAF